MVKIVTIVMLSEKKNISLYGITDLYKWNAYGKDSIR